MTHVRGAIGSWEERPETARQFIEFIEEGMGIKATFISLGPERGTTILREAAYSFDTKR